MTGTDWRVLEAAQVEAAEQKMFSEVQARHEKMRAERKPVGYMRPAFGTKDYHRDCIRGWISDDEERADHARVLERRKRAKDAKHNKTPAPHRHMRPPPRKSRQFVKPMSTAAARDDRLTPQSKALLQVIAARTGKGRVTDTTKTTLAAIMCRCPRSIQRYICELVKFGYIRTQTVKSRKSGLCVALRIWIMNAVIPSYAKDNPNYDPTMWLNIFATGRKSGETEMSPTNINKYITNILKREKPPWFAEFVFR